MPSLVSLLQPITDLPHFALNCHNSTFFWLYQATFGVKPTTDQYAPGERLAATQNIMGQLVAAHGRRINQVSHGMLSLTPGSVIVFMENNHARHSCIAINNHQVYGYNQVGWFSTPGSVNGRTMHSVRDLVWRTGQGQKNRLDAGGYVCELYAVPEEKAKQFLQRL